MVGGRGQGWNGGAEKEEVEGGARMVFEMKGEGGGLSLIHISEPTIPP